MNTLVLDASVILKWFRPDEPGSNEALEVRSDFEAGHMVIAVPSVLPLEILNVMGRRLRWPSGALVAAARELTAMGLEVEDPDLGSVAGWIGRGLTAYDAAYVALADVRGLELITDDRSVLAAAPGIARPLVDR